MNETMIIVIIGIAITIPCLISYLLVRFAPKLRYLPSVLLMAIGVICLVSAFGTKANGSGMYGEVEMGIFALAFLGVLLFLAAAIAFLISWMMYKWRKSHHDG